MLYVQVGDLKGLFGLFTVYMQMLRTKLKVLDISYGNSTGWLAGILVSLCIFSSQVFPDITCYDGRNISLVIATFIKSM